MMTASQKRPLPYFGLFVVDINTAIDLAEKVGDPIIMDGSGIGFNGDDHDTYMDIEDVVGITLKLTSSLKSV